MGSFHFSSTATIHCFLLGTGIDVSDNSHGANHAIAEVDWAYSLLCNKRADHKTARCWLQFGLNATWVEYRNSVGNVSDHV